MKRIILCRPDRVGDTIISSSCFQPLNAAGHTVFFMAREMMAPLFENHPLLEGFIPLPNSPHPTPDEKKQILQRIRDVDADMLVHLHPLPALYPLAAQSGVPIRIGHTHKGLTKHLTHAYPYLKQKGLQHEAYYNLISLNHSIWISPVILTTRFILIPRISPPSISFSRGILIIRPTLSSIRPHTPWLCAGPSPILLNSQK